VSDTSSPVVSDAEKPSATEAASKPPEAPKSPPQTFANENTPCEFRRRALALCLDLPLVLIIEAMLVFVFLMTFVGPRGVRLWQGDGFEILPILKNWVHTFNGGVFLLLMKAVLLWAGKVSITILVFLLYFSLFEWGVGGTPGKLLLRMRVVEKDTKLPVHFGSAVARNFCKLFSALPLGLGFVMAAFTVERQALHDIISGVAVYRSLRWESKWLVYAAAGAGVALWVAYFFLVQEIDYKLEVRAGKVRVIVQQTVAPSPLATPTEAPSPAATEEPSSPAATPIARLFESYAEVNGDRIDLKYTLALLDERKHVLAVYLFSKEHEPKAEEEISSFISQADVILKLDFDREASRYDSTSFVGYEVIFKAQPDGFTFEGNVPSVDFTRTAAWSKGEQNVTLPSTLGVGKTVDGKFIDEARWQRKKQVHTFRWHLEFSTTVLDKKILPD
jgi:uncharacterized RDD family membrane protein YckC